MRMTIDMPDAVHAAAKVKAAELGIPLQQFVTEALEEKFRRLELVGEESAESE